MVLCLLLPYWLVVSLASYLCVVVVGRLAVIVVVVAVRGFVIDDVYV